MGLFMQRPEEPSEWAGLPGEPLRPQSDAELLRDGGAPIDLLGAAPATTSYIEIPVTSAEPVAEAADGE